MRWFCGGNCFHKNEIESNLYFINIIYRFNITINSSISQSATCAHFEESISLSIQLRRNNHSFNILKFNKSQTNKKFIDFFICFDGSRIESVCMNLTPNHNITCTWTHVSDVDAIVVWKWIEKIEIKSCLMSLSDVFLIWCGMMRMIPSPPHHTQTEQNPNISSKMRSDWIEQCG